MAKLADPPGHPRPLLAGRDREQALLRQHLEAILAGHGRFVLIGGEAGIGKTSLCEWIAQEAIFQNGISLFGRCYDLATTPPYSPWLNLLADYQPTDDRPTVPEVLVSADQLSSLGSQADIFSHIHGFLASVANYGPLVLVLEDFHWADHGSLELLRFMAQRISRTPLLLLATYRSDELTRRHPLYQMIPLIVREGQVDRMDLKPLDAGAIQVVVYHYGLSTVDELRLVHHLNDLTEGNPFYLSEVLRSLEEQDVLSSDGNQWRLGNLERVSIPSLVKQVIDARISRLGDEPYRLLGVAAVIGQDVPLDLWSLVSEADEGALLDVIEQAVEAHLLEETPDRSGLRFSHALVRETLYEGIVLPRRRLWHRRIGEVLASQVRPDLDAVAHHFRQGVDRRAAEWLVRAGQKAQALYAPHAAIESFTQALDLGDHLSSPDQLVAYRARGAAYETTGEFEAAQFDYETTLDLARSSGDRQAEWQALLDLGMLWASRDYSRTGEYYQQALDLARSTDDPMMTARSLNRVGNWLGNLDRPVEARHYHDEALETFQSLGDRRGMAETLDFLGMALMLSGDLHRGADCYRQAIDLFRELDDRHGLASAIATFAERGTISFGVLATVTTPTESLRDAEEALRIAREIGWRSGEVYALFQVGMAVVEQGDLGRGLDAFEEALRIAEEIGHQLWIAAGYVQLGEFYRRLFVLPTARDLFERQQGRVRQIRSIYFERLGAAFLANVLIAQGEFAEAEALLDMATGKEIDLFSVTQMFAWSARAELAIARGDALAALRIVDELIRSIPNVSPDRIPVLLAILRGEALIALGRTDEAEAGLRAAIRDATGFGTSYLLSRAHLVLCKLYLKQARHEAAERELAGARAVIDRLAATIADDDLRSTFLDEAARQFPAASATRRSRRTTNIELSRRELEVLRLLADGRSDREIAGELSISPRTAMAHVANILNKLGVNSRTAAASYAIRRGII